MGPLKWRVQIGLFLLKEIVNEGKWVLRNTAKQTQILLASIRYQPYASSRIHPSYPALTLARRHYKFLVHKILLSLFFFFSI